MSVLPGGETVAQLYVVSMILIIQSCFLTLKWTQSFWALQSSILNINTVKMHFFFLGCMNPISFKKNTHWEDRKWFLSCSPIKERRMIIKSNKSDLTIKYFPWKHFMIIFSLIILNVTYLGF